MSTSKVSNISEGARVGPCSEASLLTAQGKVTVLVIVTPGFVNLLWA